MSRVTSSKLRQLLHYDPDTGIFTWQQTDMYHPRLKCKQAGCLKSGYRQIEINKVVYRASHLAWLYVHRSWPERGILHIGDSTDDRISNLKLRWEI
jgi:hypothetical protein